LLGENLMRVWAEVERRADASLQPDNISAGVAAPK
jgi:hypothetical protein